MLNFQVIKLLYKAKKLVALVLVLLQCAVPFLHAHSGSDSSPEGLHLHGFAVADNGPSQAIARFAVERVTVDDLIVTVGSAVQQNAKKDLIKKLSYVAFVFNSIDLGFSTDAAEFPFEQQCNCFQRVSTPSYPRAPPSIDRLA